MPHDGRLYHSSKKGELAELKQSLNSSDQRERKTAVKRVIAAMTTGTDVSSLFPDVIKNAMTDNFSLKKLVYLYIINHARTNPDLVILVINTFVRDAADRDPLVRALSLRTMALIRLDKVTEYLIGPLHAALRDEDPYVRKTAAMCVVKLHDANPALVKDEGFLPMLQQLLSDANPMTVANAVAALSEIAEVSNNTALLSLSPSTVPKYLSALSECTEWGQVFVLNAIAGYTPHDSEEAELMVERIIPRLQHANPAVVIAAVRIHVSLLPYIRSAEQRTYLFTKMRAPIITILASQPEMQYVALRNINLLIQRYPEFFDNDPTVFFVSYTDPLYVKVEKLQILALIADEKNVGKILAEFEEYANDVDMVFSRKAVAAIGRVAMRLPAVAAPSTSSLIKLLRAQIPHVAEEVAVALKDILRAYPGRFPQAIPPICAQSELINEPSARAALVWIVGEHASTIDNAVLFVDVFLDTYHDEVPGVQMQILTAAVKVFLWKGEDGRILAQRALTYATEETEHIDVRERGIIYTRLLNADLEAAKKIVLAPKPAVHDKTNKMASDLLSQLVSCLGSVASVYHQPPARFYGVLERSGVQEQSQTVEDLLGLDENNLSGSQPVKATVHIGVADDKSDMPVKATANLSIEDFLSNALSVTSSDSNAPFTEIGSVIAPVVGVPSHLLEAEASPEFESHRRTADKQFKLLLPTEKGRGLQVRGGLFQSPNGSISLQLRFENNSPSPMTEFAIQLNKNAFGLVPGSSVVISRPLQPGESADTALPLVVNDSPDMSKGVVLQVAVKYSPGGVVYFAERLVETLDAVLLTDGGRLDKGTYLKAWASVPDTEEVTFAIRAGPECDICNVSEVVRRLETGRLFVVARRVVNGNNVLYLSARVVGALGIVIMSEMTLPNGRNQVAALASRTTAGTGAMPFLQALGGTCQRLMQ